MFKESEKNKQLDIFSTPAEHLRGSTQNYYLKNDSWHNMFRSQITMKIDETIFDVLFCNDNGAPNASIRVLVGMMILKEGQGWSDEQMFENCNYNLLVRSALGLLTLEDTVPVASTYYLFRRNILLYNKMHQEDLLKKCQIALTKSQMLEFEVSGKQVRMDSKLLGSNIAWYSRYELIHETLRLFIDERCEFIYKKSLSKEEFELIKSIEDEDGNKVVYRSTKAEIDARFLLLGKLMYRFVNLFKSFSGGQYKTLKAVFEQQYSVSKERIVLPLENEKISAKSIQSPHDTDCHYRNKDGNKIKGYSANVTETCDDATDENQPVLNLITDVQVDVVTTADSTFLEQAIINTQKLTDQSIEKIYADGAYNSHHNQDFCDNNKIALLLTAMQGAVSRYDLQLEQQDPNKLIVTDRKTGNPIESTVVISGKNPDEKKWKIKTDEGKYRYFTLENLRTSLLRQKLKEIPIEELNKRNNVEATIFQLGYHYSNDKSRYRGLAKHKLWAYSRTMWVNFVRILKYVTQICQRSLFLAKHIKLNANQCVFKQMYAYSLISLNQNYKTPKTRQFSAF